MRYIAKYGFAMLCGVVTTLLGCGWFKAGHFYWIGAIVNVLAIIVFNSIVDMVDPKNHDVV